MTTNRGIKTTQQRPKSRQPSGNQYNHQDFDDEGDHSEWLFLRMHLNRGKRGYGFAFIYDKSPNRKDNTIAVTKIVRGGVAESDGRLKVNDVIVSVNNINFDDIPYVSAIETLRNTGPNMTLVIRRLKDNYIKRHHSAEQSRFISSNKYDDNAVESDDDSNFYQFQVNLIKRSSGGLGINIHGGYHEDDENEEESYITVSKLAPNGVADLEGTIRVGDILLQVDNQSLHRVSHERAVQMLQNTGKEVTLYLGRILERRNNEGRFYRHN